MRLMLIKLPVNKKLISILSLGLLFIGGAFAVRAQTLTESVTDHRAKLMAELDALEKEIGSFQSLISEKQKEASSLERDIAILDAKIKSTKLQIQAINLQMQTLQGKIQDKQLNINEISAKIDREKLSLAEAIRALHETDDYSVLEIMLSYNKVSDFLGDIDSLHVVQESLQESFDELRTNKQDEEVARDDLVTKKEEAGQLKNLQELERKLLEQNERDRQNLLKLTRGKESEYKKVVTTKQKSAAQIRAQLFLLQGSPAIPFERAVEYAERASVKTGVRPAFVLGVIAQESDLGKNVGQCNLPDDPPEYKWQKIMKPSRDHAPYLDITSRLGLDPNMMPLSCPMSVGYGGAMGPAQFIPSTWALYEKKIAAATGHNPPNPWTPEDAFMASAIYLSELGANTKAGEFTAAAKYFAGGNWNGSLGRTYANQVLAKVETYQEQFNIIKGIASN